MDFFGFTLGNNSEDTTYDLSVNCQNHLSHEHRNEMEMISIFPKNIYRLAQQGHEKHELLKILQNTHCNKKYRIVNFAETNLRLSLVLLSFTERKIWLFSLSETAELMRLFRAFESYESFSSLLRRLLYWTTRSTSRSGNWVVQ